MTITTCSDCGSPDSPNRDVSPYPAVLHVGYAMGHGRAGRASEAGRRPRRGSRGLRDEGIILEREDGAGSMTRTMKIIGRLLAGAAILGMAFSGAAIGEGTAHASAVPVVHAAHNDGWHAYVKPGRFYFGNGAAPFFTGLRWTSWNSRSAWATGRLWTAKPGCSPGYKCPYSSRWAGVYLNTVRWHNGVRYYARMAVEFRNAGKMRWDVGWFGYHGARVPWWQFPAVFPYL